MSKTKSSGKALPILSIVFFSVGIVLFAVKVVESIVFRMLNQRSDWLHIIVAECGKTAAFVFPAVFFIICAAMFLRRSEKSRRMLAVSFVMQLLSAVVLLGRLLYVQNIYGFANMNVTTGGALACLLLIAVLSLLSAIFEAKGKRKKVLIILIAICGFVFALFMSLTLILPVLQQPAYFGEHIALLLYRVVSGLLYAAALIFYYIALLFTAFYKERLPRKVQTVKLVMKK